MPEKVPEKVIAMPCMPGRILRGNEVRAGVDYAKYGLATWKWWCQRKGITFVLLDQPLGGEPFSDLPPTIQRWLAPEILLREYGQDARIALIDADTMVRWNAPDFFELAGDQLAAVRCRSEIWSRATIRAYQSLFPGTELPFEQYFNAGFVVLGARQLPTIRAFTDFALNHQAELRAIQTSGNFGSDQTPLNYVVQREREPLKLLSRHFNLSHSGGAVGSVLAHASAASQLSEEFVNQAFLAPGALDFIDAGYVWHFNAAYRFRQTIMQKTWERVRTKYPGVAVE